MKRKLLIITSLLLLVCAVSVVAQRIKKHGGLIDVNSSGDVIITPASGRSTIITGGVTQASGAFTGQLSTTKDPASTTNTAASLLVNPATSDSGDHLFTVAENGTSKFTVVKGGNVTAAGTLAVTGAQTFTGATTANGGITVGSGGAPLLKVLSGTGSVDFTALAAGTCETFTVTVTGAANGDSVALGIPAAAWATTEYATIEGFVSAADTVTVKRCNLTNSTTALSNPAAVTIRATVFQF